MNDESLLEFPCDFPIKVMGYNSADFETLMVEIIQQHAPDLDMTLLTARESRNGRYLSLTIPIRATSRAQLDAIYQALSDHDGVVMAL